MLKTKVQALSLAGVLAATVLTGGAAIAGMTRAPAVAPAAPALVQAAPAQAPATFAEGGD